jgi:branched-chain amino acid transport system ATP-binding protein
MTALLEVAGVSVAFGGVQAVADASLEVAEGSICALIGPNGAGKTTLFSVVSGFQRPNAGKVRFAGSDITGLPPHQVCRLGIGRTFQIVQPFAGQTVVENIAVGSHLHRAARLEALAHARQVATRLGLGPVADRDAAALPIAQRKRLEVAKALATGPKLLLLDEVLAGLNPAEIDAIVPVVRSLRDEGITILMIEHVMQAVMSLADDVYVLAGGRLIAHGSPGSVTREPAVIEAYLGHGTAKKLLDRAAGAGSSSTAGTPDAAQLGLPARVGDSSPSSPSAVSPVVASSPTLTLSASPTPTPTPSLSAPAVPASAPLLRVQGLSSGYGRLRVLHEVDIEVRPGEVVALLGSNGAGKSTFAGTLSGVVRATAGRVTFDGRDISGHAPTAIVDAGLIQVPEGRRIFPNLSVAENLALGAYRRGRERRAANLARVHELFPRLQQRAAQRAGTLSGGEQQMLAIGRAIMAEPVLLILDEPSLGLSPLLVDQMFGLIAQLNQAGVAILLVEQNVAASLEIAHRAYVMENGRILFSGTSADLLDSDELRRAYLGL